MKSKPKKVCVCVCEGVYVCMYCMCIHTHKHVYEDHEGCFKMVYSGILMNLLPGDIVRICVRKQTISTHICVFTHTFDTQLRDFRAKPWPKSKAWPQQATGRGLVFEDNLLHLQKSFLVLEPELEEMALARSITIWVVSWNSLAFQILLEWRNNACVSLTTISKASWSPYLHKSTSWKCFFVSRKTGALSLQTSKSWMRMWSMRRENLNLISRMKTRANLSRQVAFDRHNSRLQAHTTLWNHYNHLENVFLLEHIPLLYPCRGRRSRRRRGRRHHCWPHRCFLQQVGNIKNPDHISFTQSGWNSAINICFLTCSDEELEDNKALLYLPIAPEVEDPEENPFGPPPDASGLTGAAEDASASGDKKQRQSSSEMGPAKKKARTTTIELKGVPSDGRLQQHRVHTRWRFSARCRVFKENEHHSCGDYNSESEH